MPKQKSVAKVQSLKKQQNELTRKLKEAQAKARQETLADEKCLNELAGAVARKELAANPSGSFALSLLGLLAKDLTRAADRALFDLPPLTKEPKPAPVVKAPASMVPSPAPSLAAAPAPLTAPAPYSLAGMGGAKVGGG
jgi:hypothetical protein